MLEFVAYALTWCFIGSIVYGTVLAITGERRVPDDHIDVLTGIGLWPIIVALPLAVAVLLTIEYINSKIRRKVDSL